MLKKDLKQNLISAISELGISNENNVSFLVIPVAEEGKRLNSIDDCMRLGILNKENLGEHKFSLDEVTGMLSGPNSTFPLWVNLKILQQKDTEIIVELRTSLRFRTPSILKNQETGHPPFKAIKNEHDK